MKIPPHHTTIIVGFKCDSLKKTGFHSSRKINSFMKVEIYKGRMMHTKYTTELRENNINPKYDLFKIDIPDDIKKGDYIINFEIYNRSSAGRYADFLIGASNQNDLLEILKEKKFNAILRYDDKIVGHLEQTKQGYYSAKYPMINLQPTHLSFNFKAQSLPHSGKSGFYLKIYGEWDYLGDWTTKRFDLLYESDHVQDDPNFDWENIIIILPEGFNGADVEKFKWSKLYFNVHDKKTLVDRVIKSYTVKTKVFFKEMDFPFHFEKRDPDDEGELIITSVGFIAPIKFKNGMAILGQGNATN